MAKLHFKYGAMNSGKSDTLIKTAYNYKERNLNVLVIKPKTDTKSEHTVIARGGHTCTVDILADAHTNLLSEIKKHTNISCILVDEAQFLTKKQISELYQVAKIENISVICFGLRADFQANMFPGSMRLFEVADNLEKLPTMCFCGAQAEFNTRKINGKYTFKGKQVAIDGDKVTYDSLCGNCYMREGGVI